MAMFAKAFIFVCGIAAGALIYDTALEREAPKPPRIIGYTIKQYGVMPLDNGKPLFPLQRPVKEYKR